MFYWWKENQWQQQWECDVIEVLTVTVDKMMALHAAKVHLLYSFVTFNVLYHFFKFVNHFYTHTIIIVRINGRNYNFSKYWIFSMFEITIESILKLSFRLKHSNKLVPTLTAAWKNVVLSWKFQINMTMKCHVLSITAQISRLNLFTSNIFDCTDSKARKTYRNISKWKI